MTGTPRLEIAIHFSLSDICHAQAQLKRLGLGRACSVLVRASRKRVRVGEAGVASRETRPPISPLQLRIPRSMEAGALSDRCRNSLPKWERKHFCRLREGLQFFYHQFAFFN